VVIAAHVAFATLVLMNKRTIASFLWAVTALCFYELAWSLTGAPRFVGPILAIGIGALIYADPLRLLWGVKPARRIARIPEAAVPADSKTVKTTS
jgi:hypothetical protein